MVKKVILILLTITFVFTFFLTLQAKADDPGYIKLSYGVEPPGNSGDIATIKTYKVIQWWHYDGGNDGNYWRTTECTRKISDSEFSFWRDPNQITDALGLDITWAFNVPKNVQDFIAQGGKVAVGIFANAATSDTEKLFTVNPTYKIDGGKIYVHAVPHYNCRNDKQFYKYVDGLDQYIPIADEDYGSNVYSIFDRYSSTQKHLGMTYSTYSGAPLKIDFSLIANNLGYLKSGKKVSVGDSTSTANYDSSRIKIGDNTFANSGAVGLQFNYPLQLVFYVTDNPPPEDDDNTPPPVDPSDIGNITTPGATGVVKADNRGIEKFDVAKGIPTSENLYANEFAKNFLYDYKFNNVADTKKYTVNISKTYNLYWDVQHSETRYWYHTPAYYCEDTDDDG